MINYFIAVTPEVLNFLGKFTEFLHKEHFKATEAQVLDDNICSPSSKLFPGDYNPSIKGRVSTLTFFILYFLVAEIQSI